MCIWKKKIKKNISISLQGVSSISLQGVSPNGYCLYCTYGYSFSHELIKFLPNLWATPALNICDPDPDLIEHFRLCRYYAKAFGMQLHMLGPSPQLGWKVINKTATTEKYSSVQCIHLLALLRWYNKGSLEDLDIGLYWTLRSTRGELLADIYQQFN
jgi:hypothetical protein